jgi:hypothetical protein
VNHARLKKAKKGTVLTHGPSLGRKRPMGVRGIKNGRPQSMPHCTIGRSGKRLQTQICIALIFLDIFKNNHSYTINMLSYLLQRTLVRKFPGESKFQIVSKGRHEIKLLARGLLMILARSDRDEILFFASAANR